MDPGTLRAVERAGVAAMAAAGIAIVAGIAWLIAHGLPVSTLLGPPTWPELFFPAALALFTIGGVGRAIVRWRLRLRASAEQPLARTSSHPTY